MKGGFLTRVAARGRRGHATPVARSGVRCRSPIAEHDQRVGMPGFERLSALAEDASAGFGGGVRGTGVSPDPWRALAGDGNGGAPNESAGPRGSDAGASFLQTTDSAGDLSSTVRPRGGQWAGAQRPDGYRPEGPAAGPRRSGAQRGSLPPAHHPDGGRTNHDPGEPPAGSAGGPLRSPAHGPEIGRPFEGPSASIDLSPVEGALEAGRPEPPGELPARDRAGLVHTFEPAPRPRGHDAARETRRDAIVAAADERSGEPLFADDPETPPEAAVIREVHHHHHERDHRNDRDERERVAPHRTAPPARPAPVTAASVSVIGPLAAGRRSNLRFALRQR